MASEGIKFTDFHSNGAVCSPTRASLLTGKYPQRAGVAGVITAKNHRDVGLATDEITLAEEFGQYGYTCGMFGKWHLGYSEAYNPIVQGFDEFKGYVSGNVDYHAHIDQEGYSDWWQGDTLHNEVGYTTDLITRYGVEFITRSDPGKTGKPFFLYLPHEAPHSPYQGRRKRVLRQVGRPGTDRVPADSIPSNYKEMVEVLDEGVGAIIQTLKDIGQYENTILVFLSDNGANYQGDNGALRGFKGGAYEGGSRVPALWIYPRQLAKGQVNDQTVLTMDLLPTLLDFIGKKPSGQNLDGISVKDHLIHRTALPERDLFFAYGNKSFVRSGKWKLVSLKTDSGEVYELYDLSEDLGEGHDLAADDPEWVDRLLGKLRTWEKEVSEGVRMVSE